MIFTCKNEWKIRKTSCQEVWSSNTTTFMTRCVMFVNILFVSLGSETSIYLAENNDNLGIYGTIRKRKF